MSNNETTFEKLRVIAYYNNREVWKLDTIFGKPVDAVKECVRSMYYGEMYDTHEFEDMDFEVFYEDRKGEFPFLGFYTASAEAGLNIWVTGESE